MDDTKHKLLINKLQIKYKLPKNVIKKIVESQFEFIQETTKKLEFDKIKSKEEFDKLKVNFNIKYLFTLLANYNAINKINHGESRVKN